PAAGGSYWVNANLRIALDTTTTGPLTGTCTGVGAVSPCLYPIEVLNADGTVNAGQTTLLKTFMRTNPGAITYSDVPASSSHWDCLNKSDCEAKAYNDGSKYATQFPQSGQNGCGEPQPSRHDHIGAGQFLQRLPVRRVLQLA